MFKRWIATTVICQCIFTFGMVSYSHAQTNVALVDIGKVFKGHPEFSQKLQQLKARADQFKIEAQRTQQQFIQRAEILNAYEKDSQEYRDMESKLARESAELEVQTRSKMRDLLTAEARLHTDTYDEVKTFITQYCEERGIKLVLRFNSTPMSANNPATIMQRVNGNVVHYRADKDITLIIIQRINQVNGSAQRELNTQNR